jgi:hypothetical protein
MYRRQYSSGWSTSEWIIILVLFAIVMGIGGCVTRERENEARNCIATGGQWVTVSQYNQICVKEKR